MSPVQITLHKSRLLECHHLCSGLRGILQLCDSIHDLLAFAQVD
jgi:hypothetical protein